MSSRPSDLRLGPLVSAAIAAAAVLPACSEPKRVVEPIDRFRIVVEGAVYAGARPDYRGLRWLDSLGVKTILNLDRGRIVNCSSPAPSPRITFVGAHILSAKTGDVIGESVLAVGFVFTRAGGALNPLSLLEAAGAFELAGQTFTKDVAKLTCCA